MADRRKGQEQGIAEYRFKKEPFYLPVRDEVELFRIAHRRRLPVMLKGPTGCGKTRFVEHMAYQLKLPLITIACHEDLTASDLVGRYLLKGDETVWQDGPLTLAVKNGAICYLDEVVEARKDTTVVIHPLTDTRRLLPIEKKGQVVEARDEFMLVISYNPGYQGVLKELKQSTRQRFIALQFAYPPPDLETVIVVREAGAEEAVAVGLVNLAGKVRNLRHQGLEEGTSTRSLVYAATLIREGVAPRTACEVAMAQPITDDPEMQEAIRELIATVLG